MAGDKMLAGRRIEEVTIQRHWIDLETGEVQAERVACQDLEDLLGGIGRGFKLLEGHGVEDAYAPQARLVMNLGVLSGSSYMTGLRTYFHAYSPLKRSRTGRPLAMWSAGSGKFGTKLRFLGLDDVVLEGRCPRPSLLHITSGEGDEGARFRLRSAEDLRGRTTNDKIQSLHARYPDAHFAVIGPAGEAFASVRYAAIALSSENQLKSGDAKARYCGRGGMGGVLGSKNLLAIVADVPDGKLQPPAARLKEVNREVGTGDGSRRFRDAKRGGVGGTWANAEALDPSHAMPEYNFAPTGSGVSAPLYRSNFEQREAYRIQDEACFRCAIRCHKNVYASSDGRFLAKFDYEPLNLLSSNLGIFDADAVAEMIELTDQLGLDSISCGVTLAYVMEYNANAPEESQLLDGLRFGDAEGAKRAIRAIGRGELELLGRGVLRLSEALGERGYAMQCKGLEFPAYLPQTNPGYPWALAGGHMSMRTYLLLLNEGETGLDYWTEAITSPARGLSILRDDLVGGCKFAGMSNEAIARTVREVTGVSVDDVALQEAVRRTFLRGYRLERAQGCGADDYQMPARAHEEHEAIALPYFNTPEFFAALHAAVSARFEEALAALPPAPGAGLIPPKLR